MVGARADCGSHAIDRVNHKLRASAVTFARIHTPYQTLLNPAKSYALLSAIYRFGSIHISKLLSLHAEALTVGAYLKYVPPLKYPCGILYMNFNLSLLSMFRGL